MTECERIIKEGILPESFFEPELRENYAVDTLRKKVWGVTIDILLIFAEICKKNNLTWYLMFGSLLGAIRHKGFIPWDDDIDVAMPRKDYNRLIELAGEFKEPYFLQTPYTDQGYFYSYIKIRNSNTTCFSTGFGYQGYNQGIMLDIFCVDEWDINGGEERFEKIKSYIIDNSAYMKMSNPRLMDQAKKDYSGRNPFENYEKIQQLASSCARDTQYVSLPNIVVYGYEKNVFRKQDFETVEMMEFEGFKFPVPCGYHNILTTIYGDYMKLPPIEKRGIWHDSFLDPDVPYTQKVGQYLKSNDIYEEKG